MRQKQSGTAQDLFWIRIRVGSGFNDFVDPDPDWAKVLDPDLDLYWIKPDPQPWRQILNIHLITITKLGTITNKCDKWVLYLLNMLNIFRRKCWIMVALLSDPIRISCTLKTSGFKVKKRVKKLVLNVWFCAHLREIHCWCQQKIVLSMG
jgi:hypothetical protein